MWTMKWENSNNASVPQGGAVAPYEPKHDKAKSSPSPRVFYPPGFACDILFICCCEVEWNRNKLLLCCSACASIKNNAALFGFSRRTGLNSFASGGGGHTRPPAHISDMRSSTSNRPCASCSTSARKGGDLSSGFLIEDCTSSSKYCAFPNGGRPLILCGTAR